MNSEQAIKLGVAFGEAHEALLVTLDKITTNALEDGVKPQALRDNLAEWFGPQILSDLKEYRA